jgi:hypothetical protein
MLCLRPEHALNKLPLSLLPTGFKLINTHMVEGLAQQQRKALNERCVIQ